MIDPDAVLVWGSHRMDQVPPHPTGHAPPSGVWACGELTTDDDAQVLGRVWVSHATGRNLRTKGTWAMSWDELYDVIIQMHASPDFVQRRMR